MGARIRRILWHFFKYAGISIGVILLLMFLLPYLFPTFVSNKIKQWANSSIQSELNFSKARLSFFNHFPSLTLTLYDFSLKGSEPFKEDTLIAGKELALGVDLSSVFGKTIRISEIYFSQGKLNVQVDSKGLPNYNVYVSKSSSAKSSENDTNGAALKLSRIQIDECELVYNDQSIPMKITAKRLNYLGKGDLSKDIFDLSSEIKMEKASIGYDNRNYLENKNLEAKLITQVNTNSLALIFQRNDLVINKLPVSFKGTFNFLKDGYDMDFSVNTERTAFKSLFTALPPAAVTWLDKSTVNGSVEMDASLKGQYIASKKIAPNLLFNMRITDGSIGSKKMPKPVDHILLNLHFALPQLNMDEMTVKIDSLHAAMNGDEISAMVQTKGVSHPTVSGRIHAHMDIEKWCKTLGLDSSYDLRGLLEMNGNFNGSYNPKAKQFPVANVSLQLKDGYIKTGYYPVPITNIMVDADVFNTRGTTRDLKVNIKPISLNFEGQPFTIACNIENFDDLSYNINSKGVLNIGKMYKLFAIEGYDVNGTIETDLSLQGTQADIVAKRYGKLHNKGNLILHNIKLSSTSFPKPFIVQSGAFHFKDDKLMADDLKLNYGSTDASLNGYISNIINYAMQDNAVLEGKWTLNTKYLFVDEFMANAPADTIKKTGSKSVSTTTAQATGVVVIPTNLNMLFTLNADKISYTGLDLKNCQGVVAIKSGKLTISKAAFTLVDAPVNMTASYASIDKLRAAFDYHITVASFDVQKAYKGIKLFRDMASSASKAEGIVSLDYQLSGMLNENMYPIYPTLQGGGVLSLKKIKIHGLKMFSAIAEKTKSEKINNPDDLSNVDIKSKIAHNIITIERFKLRIAGFRPRFEGQVSFDGKLNMQVRLGLPPFGIIGIPLNITGTEDKPIVKVRRGKDSDKLTGTDSDADEDDKKDAASQEKTEEPVKKPN